MLMRISTAFVALSSALTLAGADSTSPLPIVDLGYELHQAIAFNASGGYYNFTNIRYAAPPTGSLRFKPPTQPSTDRSVIQTGADPRSCPQALPAWYQLRYWVNQYLNGSAITASQSQFDALLAARTLANVTAQPAGTSEDCLFLDIMVPKTIFDKSNSTGSSYGYKGAPVMVWIAGGGHVWGSKTTPVLGGDPAGLIDRSLTKGREGVIYLAINFRLGALGFSAGPSFTEGGGVPNAGLLDQRFALEWVQKYIHLFGGDPNRVTLWGHGSGGADVMFQITAYGGKKPVPFSRAIVQAPGTRNQFDPRIVEGTYDRLLELTNTSGFEELSKLPAEDLIAANSLQIYQSEFDQNTYDPTVDGSFVPALLSRSLAMGNVAKNVQVMASHNINDGIQFVPILDILNSNYTEAGFKAYMYDSFPDATQKTLDHIEYDLYPPCYTGEYGYTDMVGRFNTIITDSSFACNKYFLGQAYNGNIYALYNAIPPAQQLGILPYAYYNNGGLDSNIHNVTSAIILQDWLTTFAQNGAPTTPDVPGVHKFPKWGKKGLSMDFNLTSIVPTVDPTVGKRCAWWGKALYQGNVTVP